MGALSGLHLILGLVFLALLATIVVVPYVRILHRTGHSGWWVLLVFVPLANIIAIWVFAFVRWPALDDHKATVFD
jgi:uncharacterized membrane protein YhaH (DUF805 family)